MKIFIPTQKDSKKTFVAEQLGRAPFFYVYDTEDLKGDFVRNNYLNEAHGAGVKAAEYIINQNIDVVITPRVGEKALDLLLDSSVKIYKSNGKIIESVINDFLENKLEVLY